MKTPEENRAYQLAWYHRNKNTPKAIAARESKKSKRAAANKAYREANREVLKVKEKAKREKNRDKKNAYDKAYREANLEAIRAKEAAYRAIPEHRDRASARTRAWKRANPERIKATIERSWARVLLSSMKVSSRAKGLPAPTLSVGCIESLYAQQGGCCYWTGLELEISSKARHPLKPSPDRLDPSLGYDPGNVVLAALCINYARSDLPVGEFRTLLLRLKGINVSSGFDADRKG